MSEELKTVKRLTLTTDYSKCKCGKYYIHYVPTSGIFGYVFNPDYCSPKCKEKDMDYLNDLGGTCG